jgi:hypothetical protein
MSDHLHLVDSTTRSCCGGIGRHVIGCAALPPGVVDHGDGELEGRERVVEPDADRRGLAVVPVAGRLGANVHVSQEHTWDVVLTAAQARAAARALIAAADDLDALAALIGVS